ncbi:MAG: LpxD N-terminal domain-containing protein [Flavobacteriales bacterium]
MKLPKPHSLREITEIVGGSWYGNENVSITGINEIHVVEEGDIVFVDHPKYYDKALQSAASVVLINNVTEIPAGKAIIVCEDPFSAFNTITKKFREPTSWKKAFAQIGEGTMVAPGVHLGENVVIGKNCKIHAGVVIYDDTTLGDNVIIHANSVIGADAFYYKTRPETFDKMHTCGGVYLADHVELGALCTIDRGVTGITRIGEGTKLDAQVHVGHDTQIGKKCLMAAQVGIAGCCVIEDEVTLWGQVGLASEVIIRSGAVVLGKGGIMGELEGDKTYMGAPAIEARAKWRELALIRKLPEIIEELQR